MLRRNCGSHNLYTTMGSALGQCAGLPSLGCEARDLIGIHMNRRPPHELYSEKVCQG